MPPPALAPGTAGAPPSHDPARGEHGVGAKKKKEHFGRTAKVGAVWSLLRRGGQELVAIPTSAIMARLLVPEEFGVAAAATFFILLATRLTQFGFNAAIVRVKELRPDHTSSVFAVNLAFGVLVYLALFSAGPYIGQFLRSPEAGALLPHAALVFLITPFGTVPSALIARRLQFRYMAVSDWTDTTVGAVASVVLAMYGYGYWSLVYGQLAGTTLRVVLKMYLSGWRPSIRVSALALRELLSFGLGLQTKRLFEFATNNLDTLVVGRVLGMVSLGVYDKAFTTMNRLVNRLTLGDVYFRIFAIIHEEPLRFRRAYSRLVLSVSMLGLPAFAVAIVVARPLFLLMYGENWLPAVLPFQLLCAGGMLKLFNAYASQANEASGHIWSQAWRQGFGTVCIVVGALVGARLEGVVGAAAGVAVGMAILTISIQSLVRRTTGLTWGEMLWPQVPAITCTAILVGMLLGAGRLLSFANPDPSAWQLLAVQGATALLVYALFIVVSPFADLVEVVDETMQQLLPPRIAERVQRFAGAVRPAPFRNAARP